MTVGSRLNKSSRYGRRSRGKKTPKFFLTVVACALLAVSFVYLSRAEFLKIKTVEVAGAGEDLKAVVESETQSFKEGTVLGFIPRSNLFAFDGGRLAASLIAKYPRIKNVKVSKNSDLSVKVMLEERSPEFIWCSEMGQCYHMDSDGMIYEPSDLDNEGKIIFTGGISGDPILKNLSTQGGMERFKKLIQRLSDLGLRTSAIDLHSADKIEVYTDQTKIILNRIDEDFSEAVENAVLILKNVKSKNADAQIDYIDARFGSKVFYKTAN